MAATLEHNGKTYYFCREECKEIFQKEPEKFIKMRNALSGAEGQPKHHAQGSAAPS